jgi:hypothetical protein
MEALATVVAAIPPAALPIVLCVLGIAYLYFKFHKVEKDRAETKTMRDSDSQNIHDTLLKHTFELAALKGQAGHHEELLEDLTKQVSILNTNIVKLQVTIDSKFK